MVNIILTIISLVLLEEFWRLLKIVKNAKNAKNAAAKRVQELAYLNYLTGQSISNTESVDKSFPEFLNKLKELVGWMGHTLWRLDENNQMLIIRFTGYLPQWYMDLLSTQLLVKVGDGTVGRAVATKQPVIVNSARSEDDPRFSRFTQLPTKTGYNSLAGHPVLGRIKTYGALCSYGLKENTFKLHDAQFLLICAYLLGAILENKLLEEYSSKKSSSQ